MTDTASGEGESPELRTGVCGEVWHSEKQLVVVSLDTPVIGVQGVEELVDTAVTEVKEGEEEVDRDVTEVKEVEVDTA